MNNIDFANAAKNVASNYKTLYVMGCFGAPMSAANKTRYCNNHSYNRQAVRTQMIQSATADTFGFDCCGLIKGLLWGWSGNKNLTYGGAKYASNNVKDASADEIIKLCSDVSTDFSDIAIGEAVWMPGHIGVYVGDGVAVESTPIWKNGVQFSSCNRDKSGYNRRNWTKHGKLPWVTYVKEEEKTVETPASSNYYPAYTGMSDSLDTILKSIGVPAQYRSNWKNRIPVAEANGIKNYAGLEDQNIKLKTLARQGKLKKVGVTTVTEIKTTYYPAYTGTSSGIDTIFKAIGVPAEYCGNYNKRKPVAAANGIANYTGTGDQNIKLKTLARQGKLKKV